MNKIVEETLRDLLKDMLNQCTLPQQELFNKLYPGIVPMNKLESAIDLCDRTLKKNAAGRI